MVVLIYVRAAKLRATLTVKVNLDLISCENSVFFWITTQCSLDYSKRVEYLTKTPAVHDFNNHRHRKVLRVPVSSRNYTQTSENFDRYA